MSNVTQVLLVTSLEFYSRWCTSLFSCREYTYLAYTFLSHLNHVPLTPGHGGPSHIDSPFFSHSSQVMSWKTVKTIDMKLSLDWEIFRNHMPLCNLSQTLLLTAFPSLCVVFQPQESCLIAPPCSSISEYLLLLHCLAFCHFRVCPSDVDVHPSVRYSGLIFMANDEPLTSSTMASPSAHFTERFPMIIAHCYLAVW